MANKKTADAAPEPTVTQETLDATPGRVLTFLRGVGTTPAIRAALASRGYTADEHARGWSLLHAVSGFGSEQERSLGTASDPEVTKAIAELDAWDEDGFRIVRAALGRLHPEQANKVLEGLGPSNGPAAVVGVEALLDRIDALEKSKGGDDHAAIKTLAQRGITPAERKRLRELVAIAKKGTSQTVVEAPADDPAKAARQKALVELRAWYEDWSEMARAVIKRRDRLIRLGLAKRKAPRKPPSPPAGPPPAAS